MAFLAMAAVAGNSWPMEQVTGCIIGTVVKLGSNFVM